MTYDAKARDDRARRFRDAALLHIDDVYTLAHFLICNQAEAEDAVQQCYLHASRCFDSFHAPAMKTWLLTIVRNVCYAKLARRGSQETMAGIPDGERVEEPLRQQLETRPNSGVLPSRGAVTRQLVVALPLPFREIIVLHEFNGMSYREIAEIVGVPIGTVMSLLARARAMLLMAWKATDRSARWQPGIAAREAIPIRERGEVTTVSR
jgi:RNA polymerase sigma factor (sigma-70 family)